MKRLDVLQFFVLGRHKPHVWLSHRGADRLGVVSVILLILDEGLYLLRRNDPDRVAERLKLTLPEEGPCAGFDPDHAWWQLRQFRQEMIPSQALTAQEPTFSIGPCSWNTLFAKSTPTNAIAIFSSHVGCISQPSLPLVGETSIPLSGGQSMAGWMRR